MLNCAQFQCSLLFVLSCRFILRIASMNFTHSSISFFPSSSSFHVQKEIKLYTYLCSAAHFLSLSPYFSTHKLQYMYLCKVQFLAHALFFMRSLMSFTPRHSQTFTHSLVVVKFTLTLETTIECIYLHHHPFCKLFKLQFFILILHSKNMCK